MGPIELVVYLIKVFEKRCQCHLPLYPDFFLRFKYECTKVNASYDKPYASSFVASKS